MCVCVCLIITFMQISGQDSLSSWEIAGIVIGCLVFIVLVGACVGKKEEVKSVKKIYVIIEYNAYNYLQNQI